MVSQIGIKGQRGASMDRLVWGLAITAPDPGEALLTGPVVDQAALYGVLKKVRDGGIPLLSVNRVKPDPAERPESKQTRR